MPESFWEESDAERPPYWQQFAIKMTAVNLRFRPVSLIQWVDERER